MQLLNFITFLATHVNWGTPWSVYLAFLYPVSMQIWHSFSQIFTTSVLHYCAQVSDSYIILFPSLSQLVDIARLIITGL